MSSLSVSTNLGGEDGQISQEVRLLSFFSINSLGFSTAGAVATRDLTFPGQKVVALSLVRVGRS